MIIPLEIADKATDVLLQYGIAGVFLIVLLFAVYHQNKAQVKERVDLLRKLEESKNEHLADLKKYIADYESSSKNLAVLLEHIKETLKEK